MINARINCSNLIVFYSFIEPNDEYTSFYNSSMNTMEKESEDDNRTLCYHNSSQEIFDVLKTPRWMNQRSYNYSPELTFSNILIHVFGVDSTMLGTLVMNTLDVVNDGRAVPNQNIYFFNI